MTPETKKLNLCPFTSLFADTTGSLPFDQVQRQSFTPYRGQEFQMGFSSKIFWFRFTIDPGKQPTLNQWYLLWSDGLRDNVDIYVPQVNGTWKIMEGGMLAPPDRKAYQGLFPLYPLGVFQSTIPQTYYLRLDASEAINGQLTLLTHQAYIDDMPASLAMAWLVIGIQLLRVFYNIILARYIQDSSFRWYVFHTVIVTASVLGSFGVIGTLLSQAPRLASFFNTAFFELMPATYTLFIYSLLSVRVNYPKLKWVFFSIVGLSLLQLVLYPFVPRMYLLIANNYLFLFMEAFLISICSYALIQRVAMNGYLLIPCFITLVPFIFLNLRALGIIQYGWIYPMIYGTNFLEIVALALVLGKIIQSAEQKRLDTEKAFFAEKLEAEKLAELDSLKTRFFTNISHEFRTPLTLLIGPLSDLLKKFPTEEMYQIMHRNANRLQTLINQLLDLSKLDGGQLRPDFQDGDLAVDIRTWVASFESLAASRQISLLLQQPSQRYPAIYDLDKVEKITTNLISNALKFTPTGGRFGSKRGIVPGN
ncbi:sensor histidine kinase [Spirosoma telluris]|uniref:sensor histidine kinase n=1 Tax=Spirosoma telluris TaxID=2183553 RepID=UPI0018DDC1C6